MAAHHPKYPHVLSTTKVSLKTFYSISHLIRGAVWPCFREFEFCGHSLTFCSLGTYSADDKLMFFFFLFFLEEIWHFVQYVSYGDSLHEMSSSCFLGKRRKYWVQEFLTSVQNVQGNNIQLILVILTFLISNNHLCQSENLVTWKSNNR